MPVSQSQIVDLLYKQAFGVTKTDTANVKSPSNENIPSPLLMRGDTLWTEADQIPGIAAAVPNIIQAYTGANAVQCVADTTTVPIGSVYPTWKTNLTYWIPSQFGATYNVQVWVDSPNVADPTLTGTQIFQDGSGGNGQFYFNYQSGVLNFIGETIPAALTSSKVLYIVGYRYIGLVGVTNLPGNLTIGNLEFNGTTITATTPDSNIILTPTGNGQVISNANIIAPSFSGNFDGNISGNFTITGANGDMVFVNNNLACSSPGINFTSSSNLLTVAGNIDVAGILTDNYYYANGAPVDFQQPAGTNTQIQFNDNGDFGASNAFTFDNVSNALTLTGNVLLGLDSLNQIVNLSNTALEIRGGWNQDTNTSVNLVAGDYANSTDWGKISILGNSGGNSIAYLEANYTILTNPGAGSGNVVKFDILNYNATSNTTGALQVAGGASLTGNLYVDGIFQLGSNANIGGNLNVVGNIANANNISVTNGLSAVTGNFSGNIQSLNAVLGNLATANYVNVAEQINGNVANFSGNLTAANASLGNLATANYVNVANDLNVVGNVNAGNLVGPLANGNSNVRVFGNANVEVSIAGVANTATFSTTGFYVTGEINTTAGNMLSNGNITANGFINGANANITGEALLGSVKTGNINNTGNIAITAGTDSSISLLPNGNGVVTVNGFRITNLADPVLPLDAVTKEYVDALAGEGLDIHTPVRVESPTALNATYAQGGTTPTVDSISGNKTITFTAAHGLSVDDGIVFTNSFNGLTGGAAYWVYATPSATSITVSDTYHGPEVDTLTNGTSLAEPSRANPGVGATLTNAGTNAALAIDGITLSVNDRVLVYQQTNAYENGIYVVTTVGDGSTPWVLTRASDANKYIPYSSSGLGKGSYVFVLQGATGGGESYVMTSPSGAVIIGTTNMTWTQFAASGTYVAGNGIAINGTTISANVDNDTTAIVSGNITVKVGANLVTPNIGDATFSSLTWNNLSNGNVTANNLSIANLANITGNLTVASSIQANGAISSNANVSGLNLTTTGSVEAGANVLANNVNANTLLTVPTANVSNIVNAGNVSITNELSGNTANFTSNVIAGNVTANGTMFAANANVTGTTITNELTVNNAITGNTANFSGNVLLNGLTVNNAITGNTANFSGNVVVPNLTVNLELAGNTANFTGNITAGNANLGNLITANNLTLGSGSGGNITGANVVAANTFIGVLANGTSNVAIVQDGNINLTAGGNTTLVITPTGIDINGTVDLSGNVDANNITATNNVTANVANIASVVYIGASQIVIGSANTSSITANQTIATWPVSGVTGAEWLVKGSDSSGAKYTVATVQAVTNGTTVDYSINGPVLIGGSTGTLAVNIVGSNIALQVTPSSSNVTVWTTQFRLI